MNTTSKSLRLALTLTLILSISSGCVTSDWSRQIANDFRSSKPITNAKGAGKILFFPLALALDAATMFPFQMIYYGTDMHKGRGLRIGG